MQGQPKQLSSLGNAGGMAQASQNKSCAIPSPAASCKATPPQGPEVPESRPTESP